MAAPADRNDLFGYLDIEANSRYDGDQQYQRLAGSIVDVDGQMPLLKFRSTLAAYHSDSTIDPRVLTTDVNVGDRLGYADSSDAVSGTYPEKIDQATAQWGGLYQLPDEGLFPAIDAGAGVVNIDDGLNEAFGATVRAEGRLTKVHNRQQRKTLDAINLTVQSRTTVRLEDADLAKAVANELMKDDREILKFSDEDFRLTISTPADAHVFIHARKSLTIVQDDWIHVERNMARHVREILRAMTSLGFIPTTAETAKTGQSFTEQEAESWVKWQNNHVKKVHRILSVPLIRTEIEARALLLFEQVLKPHKHGARVLIVKTDRSMTCSQRLAAVLQSIKDYPIVRADVLDELPALEALAADPSNFCQLKRTYWSNNRKRAEKAEDSAGTQAASRVAVVPMKAEVAAFTHGSWKIRFSAEELAEVKVRQKSMLKVGARGEEVKTKVVQGKTATSAATGDVRRSGSSGDTGGLIKRPAPRSAEPRPLRQLDQYPRYGGGIKGYGNDEHFNFGQMLNPFAPRSAPTLRNSADSQYPYAGGYISENANNSIAGASRDSTVTDVATNRGYDDDLSTIPANSLGAKRLSASGEGKGGRKRRRTQI